MITLLPEQNERVKDETCYKETKILSVMRKTDAVFLPTHNAMGERVY
jgi:hypothetical protein